MTHRERLLAPFRGMAPQCPAWVADLSYWHAAHSEMGDLDPRHQGREGYDRLHRDLGVCLYYTQPGATFAARYDGVETGTTQEDGSRVRWWRTPEGELSERWEYLPRAHCWARTRYAARSAAELRVVQQIAQRTRHAPAPEGFLRTAESLGDDGLPISPTPRSPLPALMTDWCGVTATCYLIADEPQAVEDTLAILGESADPAYEAICAGPSELIHVCDNLDSASYTSYFEPYMEAYYRRRLAQLHAAGKVVATHLDGMVRGLLPRLADVGFDAVESITPAPVGDVEIEELRALCRDRDTVIWGGIPGAMFTPPWTSDDLRSHTRRLIDALAHDGRLILGSADQVPPDGDIDLCRVIAEAIQEHARA